MSGAKNARRSVSVRIAGHDYKIRGEGDEEALIRIAGYVDRAMDRIRVRTGTVDSHEVAVLTCLNLAREILAIHDQKSNGVESSRLQGLIERVESALDGRAPRARSVESSAEPAPDAVAAPVTPPSSVRTLELPSVEELSEHRPSVAASVGGLSDPASALPRAAAGGRDRNG